MNVKKFLLLATVVIASTAAGADEMHRIATLRETADSLHSIGRTDSAALIGATAVELAEKSGDPIQIVGTNAAQGVFLRSLGRIDEALESYNKALEIATSGEFRKNPSQEAIEEIASLYINLAVLNLDMQHKEDAARNASLAGEWISKSRTPDLKSTIWGVAGSVMTGCGQLEKAMEYQGNAYSYALEAKNQEAAFRASAYTMLIADRLDKKQDVEQWREKCMRLMPEINSTTALLVYYQAECSIALHRDKYKDAINYFDKILNLDGIDKMPFIQYDCYNNMHQAYAAAGNFREAYSTLLKSNALRDSIWEQEKTESLRNLMVKYETKETELALVQSTEKQTRTLMWLFASIGALLAAIVAFMAYVHRQRRLRMKRELEFTQIQTQQYIEGLETERKRMARELHDGVCNDLLAIELNMTTGTDSTALLRECRESVRRISHELMPPEFAYANIDEVIRYFVSKQPAEGTAVSYSSHSDGADWREVPDSTALEIYRIVQEAVGNALKHSGGNKIEVEMTLDKRALSVCIKDNGQMKKCGNAGLGIESMERRAAAIKGHIALENIPTGGTAVRLTVNL